MKKQSRNTMIEKSSSKNPLDIKGESYVFVKYSDLMDLIRSAKDASIALSHLANVSADIKLMSMRPAMKGGSYVKWMDISDTKPSTRSLNRISEVSESGCNMDKTLRFTDLPLLDSQNGQTKKSRRR